jgi:hypothetical protein
MPFVVVIIIDNIVASSSCTAGLEMMKNASTIGFSPVLSLPRHKTCARLPAQKRKESSRIPRDRDKNF